MVTNGCERRSYRVFSRQRSCKLLSTEPPRGDVRFSDNSLSDDIRVAEIRPFMRAYQVLSRLYLDFDLSARNGNSTAIRVHADTKASTDIPDVRRTHLYLQLAGLVAFHVEISVASQQFDPGRQSVGDGDHTVRIQTDVDIWRSRDRQALSRYGFVNPGCGGCGNIP